MKIYATDGYYKNRIENERAKKDDSDIGKRIKGIVGERQVFRELKELRYDKYPGFIIPNFKFYVEEIKEYVECDFIVVTKNSIIIIEVKNWATQPILDEYGSTKVNGEWKNFYTQVKRQMNNLQEKIEKDLSIVVKIKSFIAMNDMPIKLYQDEIPIVLYTNVYRFIDNIIKENINLNFSSANLRRIHKYLIEKEKISNLDFNEMYYTSESDNNSFLNVDSNESNISIEKQRNEESLYITKKVDEKNHFKYLFRLRQSNEKGTFVLIPNNIKNINSQKIDNRVFAVLYNLLIRGDRFFWSYNSYSDDEKFKLHYFILCSLFFIKNNYFTICNDTINIPIFCTNEIELEAKKVFVELIELFAKVSDVTNYNIQYINEYKILFDDEFNSDNIEENKIIYIKKNRYEKPVFTDGIWQANTIIYSLEKDEEFIKKIVFMLFGFESFRDGQLECINKTFSSNNNQIIMLPTGQGKSIIFYLLLILQPKMGIIIYPTSMLIKDQIMKLNEFGINNINNFSKTKKFNNSHILMMTPDDSLEINILKEFDNINKNVSYVILDEVHCLSKFSHDFRPEYFLLYDKINSYLHGSNIKGFTATATYGILEDLMKQFKINEKEVFSPNLSKNNVEYIFKNIKESQIIENLENDIKETRRTYTDDKILVFTKNIDELNFIKKGLASKVNNIVYITDDDDYDNYANFRLENGIYGDDVLVSFSDFGIGIDMPEINTIIHVTQPLSIADFVQHTGRAGRSDYFCTSIVYYDENVDETIFINNFENIDQIINEVYEGLKNTPNSYWETKNIENSKAVKSYKFVFYCFFELGIISDWWRNGNKYGLSTIETSNLDFSYIKNRAVNKFKNEKSFIFRIKRSNNIIELAKNYYEWFIETNYNLKKESYYRLTKLLNYFVSNKFSIEEIRKIITAETYYNNYEIETIESIKKMSFTEIVNFSIKNRNRLNNYSKYFNSIDINISFLTFLYDLINNSIDDDSNKKLNFILDSLSPKEKFSLTYSLFDLDNIYKYNDIMDLLYIKVYRTLNVEEKIKIYSNLKNNIDKKYQYLFSFSIINDYLKR